MIEDYAVAALYLVPVAAAAVVAYLVTRKPAEDDPQVRLYELPEARPRAIPAQRESWEDRYDRYIAELSERPARPVNTTEHSRRESDKRDGAAPAPKPLPPRSPNVSVPPADQSFMNAPTLMNAALSAHLSTVSREARGRRVPIETRQIPDLASIRRPTRLNRRAAHRCARKTTT